MDAYLREVMAWCMVLADPASGLDDPSTLVRILEQLTAQRYQYPSAIARVVGQAIQSLEAYLAAHAPRSPRTLPGMRSNSNHLHGELAHRWLPSPILQSSPRASACPSGTKRPEKK